MEKSIMPCFDFKCEECGEEREVWIKWSKDMADKLEPCKCGAKKWKRVFSVSMGKTREFSQEEIETNEMCKSHWY